jgi:hypothetical protein
MSIHRLDQRVDADAVAGRAAEDRRSILARLAAPEIEARPELRRRAAREAFEIRLVDEEDVGPLEDARLHELDEVPCRGLSDEDQRLDEVDDAGLGLPDADGLDEDRVEGGGEDVEARAGDLREAAELIAGGERAQEDPGVSRRGAETEAIAEERAAGLPARGIDGEDADRPAAAAQVRGEGVEQGRLARAGRAGDADAPAARVAFERIEEREGLFPALGSTRLRARATAPRSPARTRSASSTGDSAGALMRRRSIPRRRRRSRS